MKIVTLVLAMSFAIFLGSSALAAVEDFKELIVEAQNIQFDLHQVVLEKVEASQEAFEFESQWRNPQNATESEAADEMLVKINMSIAQAK